MRLNLTDVLASEGRTENRQALFSPTVLEYGKEQYPIVDKTPVQLTIANVGKGKARIDGRVTLTVMLCCDRCLGDVPYVFSLEISRTAVAPGLEAAVSEREADTSLVGYQLDVDDLVYSEIFVNWPMKVLCRPDCKGICSVCGKNLNEGACGCDPFVPDPRLAAIKDIFNAGKEV